MDQLGHGSPTGFGFGLLAHGDTPEEMLQFGINETGALKTEVFSKLENRRRASERSRNDLRR